MQARTRTCLSMALCDEVLTDPATGKKSVIGIFEDVWACAYPGLIPRFWIFAEFLGFTGTMPVTAKLYRRTEGKRFDEVSSIELPVYSLGPEALARLELEVRELVIPEPGEYLIALEVLGTRIGARRLLARTRGKR